MSITLQLNHWEYNYNLFSVYTCKSISYFYCQNISAMEMLHDVYSLLTRPAITVSPGWAHDGRNGKPFCSLVPNLFLKLYLPIISGVKHHHCSSTALVHFKENLAVTHSLNMYQNLGLRAALKVAKSFGIHFISNITSQITLYVFNWKQSVISGTKKKMQERASSIFLY